MGCHVVPLRSDHIGRCLCRCFRVAATSKSLCAIMILLHLPDMVDLSYDHARFDLLQQGRCCSYIFVADSELVVGCTWYFKNLRKDNFSHL